MMKRVEKFKMCRIDAVGILLQRRNVNARSPRIAKPQFKAKAVYD